MIKGRLIPAALLMIAPVTAAIADDDTSSSETVEQILTLSGSTSSSAATTITFSGDSVVVTTSEGTTTEALEDATIQFSYGSVTVDEASTDNGLSDKESTTFKTSRTISSDYWNTLVLPFDLDEEEIADIFGEGTKVAEFTSATSSNIRFDYVSSTTAGKPFIIKPATTVTDPEFKAVDVDASLVDVTLDDYPDYTYKGLYDKTTWESPNDTIIYISTAGTFKTLTAGGSLRGLRGYFKVAEGTDASAISFGIVDEESGETTAITSIDGRTIDNGGAVYSISGQYVGTSLADLPKGIYITNGKKVVVK